MRLLNKLVLLTVGFITFLGCAQNKKNITKNFNLDQYVDSIAAKVKHYPQEPMYYLRINQLNCIYEVLVNDKLIDKNYSLKQYATATEINSCILKSGVQKVTYRLYPIGDLIKEEYGEGETVTTLLGNTEITIEVIRVADINTYKSIVDDERLILKHESKKDLKTNEFVGSELPYYEYTFTFDAQVPYEIEGWTNAIDLRKQDQEKLELAIVNYYKEIQQLYKANDAASIMNMEYAMFERLAVTEYRDRRYIKEMVAEVYDPIFILNKDYQPIKDYKIQYFADGKIVRLWHPSIFEKPDLDPRLNRKSAFYFLYTNKDNRKRVRFQGITLSIPKDKHKKGEFNFEFAR
ncbi:hypothetical protein [Cellulophaga sp. E6(2014)]|uniref:hypothetical protein n=1 Tax=Cellulophaga sp. E6(2014) TaxID=1495334 RepID=UPI00051DB923|nr:hypothetical protein [Cellulophaga sp. E6(2014)]KGK30612.1 hypothetical protein EL45_09385 [Cellulophaga sp. E6(2014)]